MKNNKHTTPSRSMMKNFAILIITILAGFSAKAQNQEITPIELEVEYSGPAFKSAYFSFTAPQDGKFITTGNIFNVIYSDASFQTEVEVTNSYVNAFKETQMMVTAGTTYYIAIDFPLDAWWFKASMNDGKSINLVSTSPEANTVFPLGNGGFLSLTFDSPVSIGSAVLQTGATTAEISGTTYGKDVSFELKNTLFHWLQSGVMKAGDTFTLTINGIKSANDPSILYNGDGKLVLSWTSSEKPAEVVKSTLPNSFKSYWATTAPDGIATIEYDAEISAEHQPQATISFGDAEVEGEYYVENIPVTVSGKILSLDFRGKRRIPSNMVASGTNYGTMRLKIYNIRTTDGNYVYSEGQGTFGSFQHSFSYEFVAVDLTTEFTPASGTSLTGVNSVELWLSDGNAVTFDGVNVEYKDANNVMQTVTYTKDQCNYTDNGLDGATLNIPITAEMQAGTNVTITLTNLSSIDGTEREITATYNIKEELILEGVAPVNNSVVEELSFFHLFFNTGIFISENAKATITNTDNGNIVGSYNLDVLVMPANMEYESSEIYISLETPITEAGNYSVTIPAGVIGNASDATNDEIILNYQVKPSTSGIYFFTPADGSIVESLSKIMVEYTDGFGVSWNYDAVLTNANGEVVAKSFTSNGIEEILPENQDAPITQVNITLQDVTTKEAIPITTPGVYTLTLPKGFFNLGSGFDTEDSPEVTATFTIQTSGIDGVISDNASVYEVYNLQGISIMSTTDKSAIDDLNEGLYIINGKKVYINK